MKIIFNLLIHTNFLRDLKSRKLTALLLLLELNIPEKTSKKQPAILGPGRLYSTDPTPGMAKLPLESLYKKGN
jgi:hypothetical protein